MAAIKTHRYIARITIEFLTPFIVGAGRSPGLADVIFVSDVNGLPTIPGSSIAGVLRSAFRKIYGRVATDSLFGFQAGDEGQGSRIEISWAYIHDSHNRPVEGIVPVERLEDPVLVKAACPAIRDHVRINHKGAGDSINKGKFDEQALCPGHRFTFEISLSGTEETGEEWLCLINLLGNRNLRLGGRTRRGFGAFRISNLESAVFDIRKDFAIYRRHPLAISEQSEVLNKISAGSNNDNVINVSVSIKPKGYWMFGGGEDIPDDNGNADMAPLRDDRIVWDGNGTANIVNSAVIPATALKGALSHRTAFHYNALDGRFSESGHHNEVSGENNPAVKDLFGYSKNDDGGGQRGRVIIDDIYFEQEPAASQFVSHVGINRFTGGSLDGVLFNERPFWKGGTVSFSVLISEYEAIKDWKIKKSFAMAIQDLVNGDLQLGAGYGRGLGYFEGTAEWPPDEDWTLIRKTGGEA